MLKRILILIIALALPWVVSNVNSQDGQQETETEQGEAHDSDDGHDHDGEVDPDHETESADAPDHDDELSVELSDEAMALAGLKVARASHGKIAKTIDLPGEIGFNEDQLAHIAPRFAGIAQRANYRVGDYVERGAVMAVVESNESMTSYTIAAPMSGWVIERHVTPGEFVSEENSIFLIADLSSVWVNLAVYPKDCHRIKKGQEARIKAVGATDMATGTIEYITPIIDFRTRSATARIVLPNPENAWRPGTFVQASIGTEAAHDGLLVEKKAIQILDGQNVLFVVDGLNRFTPVEIVTGESNANFTEVVSGIGEGTRYVSDGAFELKAKIVTSNLDAHAGHNH